MARALTLMRTDRPALGWLFGLIALFFMASALSGCNTMRGVGQDVEAAGDTMSDTAEDAQREM